MAQALRFHGVVSGKRLTLADLDAFEGKRVEVIVLEDEGVESESQRDAHPSRRLGTLAGKIQISDDIDVPAPAGAMRFF